MTAAEYQARTAQARARNALEHARATLESALRKLDDYTARFDHAASLDKQADLINWTLNHLATYIPANLQLDLLASAQAELTRAATLTADALDAA